MKYLSIFLCVLLVASFAYGVDQIMTGFTYDGMVAQIPTSPHASMVAIDSALTIELTLNTWATIKNPVGTFYDEVELSNFTAEGDSLIYSRTGDFLGFFSLSWTGTGIVSYEVQVLSGGNVVAKGATATSAQVGGNIILFFYPPGGVTAGDALIAQIRNVTNNADVVVSNAAFLSLWLHD